MMPPALPRAPRRGAVGTHGKSYGDPMTDGAHQHSAELVDLLVNAISRLIKSKQGVIDFFAGCGVPDSILKDHRQRLRVNPSEVKKPIVARQILHALNAGNERFLGERRRVLQRVADWSDFSTCWPNDRDEAELYVQRVRKNIDSQDAFTRMNIEAQKERQKRLSVERIATEKKRKREEDRAKIRGRLVDLVSAVDPQ
jgi:restriction system protein